MYFMKTENPDLMLKKQTLAAWTKLLFDKGDIDLRKYNRMLVLIERLTA